MVTCPSCGRENDPDARFCPACGAALSASGPSEASREERKTVTVLFADLVGFTSRAEELDPEDVRALLSPYYARLREELERHGGTVEKFIGDAVVALFGAPSAHEDDPERAVRAALAIRDWIREEESLQVRVAVNTGEALVSLGARPTEGEGMATGDVVNTAARLQSAAPVNGILVGERTYRATRNAIDYRDAGSVEAKGKDAPVLVWEALQARARLGADIPSSARTALVGRERELDVLRGALDRVREEASPQLVTLVGVPGVGKSRLLYELSQIVEADPDLIFWRQGRSLPYGAGISFSTLAEIVKSQAGILETDDAAGVERKLHAEVLALVPDPREAEWVRTHVAPLAGLVPDEADRGEDRRSEAFAAWRRFLEALAEQRPLVLVFEDLHWADDGVLDFVDHLIDWAGGVPILVVATARPELLERRPAWGGGKPNATTLSLAPLSDEDTARLIASVLGRAVRDAGEQTELLERAGGNPLYAEQYAQMLRERGDGEALPLPESIQGILGARLDALSAPEKQLLQDAAVIGKVFWSGAVGALGEVAEPALLEEGLHSLERKQFVRRDRRSSVADETQYAFSHVLLRDAAYGQIPRAARAEKHECAARWLEALGRTDDQAELVAYHYRSALEFAQASGQPTGELALRARAALTDAGDRARALNAYAAAAKFYREALALCPEDEPEWPALLFRLAQMAFDADEQGRGELLDRALHALLAVGDRERAAETEAMIGESLWMRADRDASFAHLQRAHELVDGAPPSPQKARVLSQIARFRSLAGEPEEATAREALELAERFGLDEVRAQSLMTIGLNLWWNLLGADLGGGEGRAEIEQGLAIALEGNMLLTAIRGYSLLATFAEQAGDLNESARLAAEAVKLAERLGGPASLQWARGNMIIAWLELGEWDRAVAGAEEFFAQSAESAHYLDPGVRLTRAHIRLARGKLEAAMADQATALERARQVKDPQILYLALAASALILAESGNLDEAAVLLDELVAGGTEGFRYGIGDGVWVARLLGRSDEVLDALAPAPDTKRYRAGRAVLAGELAEAAAIFDSMGAKRSAALARLRDAEQLVREGRTAEADEQLALACGFFRAVGASYFLRQAEGLLAEAS